MAAAATRSGRDPASVTLVAVSKGQSVETIRAAYELGHRHFGENRAAELADKAPQLPGDIVWHFVGTLQRRRIELIRPVAALVHSLDRLALIDSWSRSPAPPMLVQVNVAAEQQKHGVAVDKAGDLVAAAEAAGIACRGLMLIPPLADRPEQSRPWFQRLATLQRRLAVEHPDLVELSMGMTDDFEVAIEEGASLIRVGRAIFGARR
ncbi:MAG: YggS family pyridoxal phosphate-dependent enzyme [Acidimicrobiia bacterium]|nr:YggS family pyridoxal phosphate-dependent enzyme [Acidimicrobiia bacterium]